MAWIVDDWDIREIQHITLGNEIRRITLLVFVREQTYPIAVMTLTKDKRMLKAIGSDAAAYVEMVLVNDVYRREGVARRLWKLATQRFGTLCGSPTTEAGEGFMRSLDGVAASAP